jgi:hypothetical protein
VAGAAESIRRRGVTPDVEAIQRSASRDLEAADRLRAAAKAKPRREVTKPDDAPNPAAKMAADRKADFFKEQLPAFDKVRPVAKATPKDLAITSRIAELCRLRSLDGRNKAIDERDFLYPKFAKQIIAEWMNWATMRGPYRRLDQRQRTARFYRELEKIAERSSTYPGLGPFWVK